MYKLGHISSVITYKNLYVLGYYDLSEFNKSKKLKIFTYDVDKNLIIQNNNLNWRCLDSNVLKGYKWCYEIEHFMMSRHYNVVELENLLESKLVQT